MFGSLKKWAYEKQPDAVRIFQLARYELQGRAAHIAGRISPAQRQLIASLRGRKHLRLNIASGGVRREGWVGIDASSAAEIRMDLRQPLPFDDGAAKYIFCEHFCDHLNYPHMIGRFLRECRRVLEPGGRARFVMHDARGLARAFLADDRKYFEAGGQGAMSASEAVNQIYRFNDFHQFLYDHETFERLLLEAGFARAVRAAYLQSEDPDVVLDHTTPDREPLSMYIEGVR